MNKAHEKKATIRQPFLNEQNYLFITYIVTSKPKRISVAAGVVHMIFSLKVMLNWFSLLLD
jgi:hypothetical protein